jgi:hypothetical protein
MIERHEDVGVELSEPADAAGDAEHADGQPQAEKRQPGGPNPRVRADGRTNKDGANEQYEDRRVDPGVRRDRTRQRAGQAVDRPGQQRVRKVERRLGPEETVESYVPAKEIVEHDVRHHVVGTQGVADAVVRQVDRGCDRAYEECQREVGKLPAPGI